MRLTPGWSLSLALACGVTACASPTTRSPVGAPSKAAATAQPAPGTAGASTTPVTATATAQISGVVSVPTALTTLGGGSIVASGAGNIVASGAGNIVASGAGNIVASGAGNLISPNGGTFRLLQEGADEVPLANTEVALMLATGSLVTRQGKVLVVRTDAQGNYRFRSMPVGATFQVVVYARTAKGAPALLKALARPAAEGAVADVSLESTLVTTNAVKGKTKLGQLDLEALHAAIVATRKAILADLNVDLTNPEAVSKRMDAVAQANPDVARSLTTVNQKLDLDAREATEVAAAVNASTEEPDVLPGALCAPMPEPPVLLVDEAGKPAMFGLADAVAVDGTGSLYVADRFADAVLKFQASGGKGEPVGADPGAGALAVGKTALFVGAARESTINRYLAGAATALMKPGAPFGTFAATAVDPGALAAGDDGTLYVADSYKNRVLKATLTAAAAQPEVEAVAGIGALKSPQGLALDAAHGLLYVADTYDHTVRQLDLAQGKSKIVVGVSGEPGEPTAASEAAAKAHLNQPHGLAVDAAGTLYIADAGNQAIRVLKDGKVTTLTALQCGGGAPERLTSLGGIALSGDGRWLFVANGAHVVRFTVGGAVSDGGASGAASPTPTPKASADAAATTDAVATNAARP